jgi:arylsulfatase A-like enzyme
MHFGEATVNRSAMIVNSFTAALMLGCSAVPPNPVGPAAPSSSGVSPSPSGTSASVAGPTAQSPSPGATQSSTSTPSPAPTPIAGARNILLIIADDLGIDASPCYEIGAEKPEMPNLEQMCREGVVFDTAWVNPMCTPTRASMLTGQYGFRTDVLQVTDVLDEGVETAQDVLSSGVPVPYSNAVVGKWHVSGDLDVPPDAPAGHGVGHYAGFLSGAVDSYFDWDFAEDGTEGHTTTYTTTWITNKAIDWIGEQQKKPWFLWLAYNAPHWPYHLPPAGLARNVEGLSGDEADIDANPRPYFLAAAEALDTEMGRLLDSMHPDVRANTTVVFIGDNGTERDVVQAPYSESRAKFSIYDGGLHVPLVVSGKGVTRRGQHEDSPVNGVDVTATILRLAGAPSMTFHDGMSFDGALTAADFGGREFVYSDAIRKDPFDGRPGWAVRDSRYELIEYESGIKELYDVLADPGEYSNLMLNGTPAQLMPLVERMEAYQASL